ncbi:unnamed protein product [Caenorhabditis angaria]|uniref:Uncharacterized protein n=1 Tax=Caenorhabditis angaria TaxID=860376 RepID=A0A9P1N402_9PELO|nr:unnamed protein product [Caenorhabditis angaria]
MSFFENLYSTHSANISAIGGPGIFGKIGTPNWFYVSHSQPIDLKVEISSTKTGKIINHMQEFVQHKSVTIIFFACETQTDELEIFIGLRELTTGGTLNGLLDKVQKAKSEISVTTGPNMRSEPSFSQLSDRTWANYARELTNSPNPIFSSTLNSSQISSIPKNVIRNTTKEIRIAWFFGGEKIIESEKIFERQANEPPNSILPSTLYGKLIEWCTILDGESLSEIIKQII